ncbi:zinc finger CCCH domain-containing protein 18-like isoform X2 [Tripterygium wilfordii]|uniref:zinc finger CCCH domain-containing protein 18-like isoform X2 n=1 Tax=Tripterygium wilfordii TaxID=458696 RepID=UPI0018F7F15F|nr:zinc finger CCCH domain-containing protein 18-like isoform X2 [Tripterygium wilfordii]
MDFSESTKVVYNRVQKLEPENVTKVIGYLLLQDYGEREMIRLAFGHDNMIHSLINKAKTDLGLSKPAFPASILPLQVNSPPVADHYLQFAPYSRASSCPVSSPASFWPTNSYWESQVTDQQHVQNLDFVQSGSSGSVAEDYRLRNQIPFLKVEGQLDSVSPINSDFLGSGFYTEPAFGTRTNRRSPSLPEFPVKVCHYFNKGFCKHGNNCRYFHGHPIPESFSQVFSPGSNDSQNEDHLFSPLSIEKLELEITELLKSRRGYPVSIASLPMLYYEKYGKTLQAEGYLTESQRHGKTGFSLTKLLARLKNSICLVDRPHGQHAVILVEDIPKYLEYNSERNDPGGIVASSRQIYLTFPAESTFSEQDVSNYFNKFGPVRDVRIPCQQKRMFGFVTFFFAETVKQIFSKANPHFVCGARVLVKPYREKSKLVDWKYTEKMHHPMFYNHHFLGGDSEFYSMPRVPDNSSLLRKQLMDEHEHVLEVERRRLSDLQLAPNSLNHQSYFGYSMDEWRLSEDFPSAERLNYLLDVLNTGSNSEDKVRPFSSSYNDPDSNQGLNLPDSPFASPIRGGISTAT